MDDTILKFLNNCAYDNKNDTDDDIQLSKHEVNEIMQRLKNEIKAKDKEKSTTVEKSNFKKKK